jgi:aminocarboxymuconate-semialdehyde decarboxylase
MTSRRSFLKNSVFSGISFCSCAMLDSAFAQYPLTEEQKRLVAITKDAGNDPKNNYRHPNMGNKRKPTFIDGRRITTIDTHAHCFFPEAVALAGEGANINASVKGGPQHYIPMSNREAVQYRLDTMDAMGIDMQILSVNVFWYNKSREIATEICRINNENLAALSLAHPGRFAAFGCIAMQFPDLAVKQLEALMKMPGMKGAGIQAKMLEKDYSDPMFEPVLAKAEELGAVLFMHPQSTPQLANRFKGNGWLSNTIGNPLDTTIALQHLIFDGTLDKFPNLKILAPHGGGFLGSYAPRMDVSCFISPTNCDPKIVLKKKPTEYLRQIYFDSLVFTPEGLRHLVAEVGSSQVMIGTDQPIPWNDDPITHILNTPLSNKEKAQILGLNAAQLFKVQSFF